MDIHLLSDMVKELIIDNDTVSLPGFGTFVAALVPATFTDRGYSIDPPYRKLTFVQSENDDTLLVDLYAKSNDIELESAKTIIYHFMAELSQILRDERSLVFPGVGQIKLTRNDVCLFIQDETLDISPDFYGLQPISLKAAVKAENASPIVMTGIVEPEDAKPEDAEDISLEMPQTSVKPFRWWILILFVVVILGLVLGAFMSLARLNPELVDKLLYSPEELQILNFPDTFNK